MNQNKIGIGRSQTNRKYFIDSNCATQDNVKIQHWFGRRGRKYDFISDARSDSTHEFGIVSVIYNSAQICRKSKK